MLCDIIGFDRRPVRWPAIPMRLDALSPSRIGVGYPSGGQVANRLIRLQRSGEGRLRPSRFS
jgi:hypothetical protein